MGPFRKKAGEPAADTFDLYYASDVHGSDQCWRKFLGAGRFYDVDALIMGGDLTGKAIIPIIGDNGTYTATVIGEKRTARTDKDLEELESAIRYNGMYPWVTDAAGVARHSGNAAAQGELFEQVMHDELRRWIALADERMAGYGIDVFVMAGNDDPWSVDEVLAAANHVQFCDDKVVRVGKHEMISCGFANRTPWDSPRELNEDALYQRIKVMADQIEDPSSAIFNLHVPPFGSGLDRAAEVDPETMSIVFKAGEPNMISVGSAAVRQIIEEYQPLLSLHGHIHESRNEAYIGRTLAINTGSEYNSGRIHGAVVNLSDTVVVKHQFVVG